MNGASASSAAQQIPAASVVREIPLDRIHESTTNPRSRSDETALTELAANIRQHGVLHPVIVRQRTNGNGEGYELVIGSRRYRASKLARRETIPATVRELSDAEAAELQLVENLLREDVHELDEASGYAALVRLNPTAYTVETIALKVSRSPAYVSGRLQLLKLIGEAQQAFRSGKLTVAHAFEIARLQPNDQRRAIEECFPAHRNPAAILKDSRAEAVSVRELRAWIEREVHLDLASAPFDTQDASLVPSAGSCARCTKRTGNNPLLFPETNIKKSTCTDRECFRAKVEALVHIRVESIEKQGEAVLRVSQAPAWQTGRPANVLHEGQFRRAQRPGECATTKPAVFVDGRGAGTIFHVCQNEKCTVHAGTSRYQPSAEEREQRAKEALAERIEKQTRIRLLDAIRKKLPASFARPDLEMVAADYFLRLGHDNHRRLCRAYGWEEKKTKGEYGASVVDYLRIAGDAIRSMSFADLHRFLVICALAPDLSSPSYEVRTLPKESNLARTAARYKIDIGKVVAAVRTELAKKKKATARARVGKPPESGSGKLTRRGTQ